MDICLKNEYTVESTLSKDELNSFGLTYDELDYGNIETKRVIWSIFGEIKKRCNINFSLSGKILIEVIPNGAEYISFRFTSLNRQNEDAKSVKQLIKKQQKVLCAEFDCFEDMLTAILKLPKTVPCDYYEKDGKIRLLLILPSFLEERTISVLSEFTTKMSYSELEVARSKEFWNLIIKNTAINDLFSYFSKN